MNTTETSNSNLFNNSISAISQVSEINNQTFKSQTQDTTMNEPNFYQNGDNQQQQEDESCKTENDVSQTNLNQTMEDQSNNNDYTQNSQDMSQNGDCSQNGNEQNGNSASNGASMEPEQFRKVFIGGLSYKTDDETFKGYFSKYGELVDYVVMKDKETNKSRGFGFVTYASSSMVDELMKNRPHIIDGRQVEPKRATPREDSGKQEVQMTVKKLFIGGIRDNINEEDLKQYFGNYGTIVEAVIMRDKEKNTTRGFGFISFDDYDPVDKIILEKHHTINGVNLHTQKALPKDGQGQGNQQGGNNRQHGNNFNGNFRNNNNNFNNNGFNNNGNGFTNFQRPNNGGNFQMQPNRNQNSFNNGNNSMNNTYGSYNQAPKMNNGGHMGNNNRRGGGGAMKGGQGKFMNRSNGPYSGGNNRGRGGGGRGGGNRNQNNSMNNMISNNVN